MRIRKPKIAKIRASKVARSMSSSITKPKFNPIRNLGFHGYKPNEKPRKRTRG
jgi:hypothetical protein